MKLSQLTNSLIMEGEAENIAVCVGVGDQVIAEVYQSRSGKIDKFTKFDMASVSKVLATTTIALIALDQGLIALSDSVSKYFDCPDYKGCMTVENLLTHTIGIGHKSINVEGNNYDTIAEYILKIPLDIPIGSNVTYSCPGFILLGKILEKVFGQSLDVLLREMVALPLGMYDTSYLPTTGNFVNSNLSPDKIGVVNDYNCQFLGGVSGNAGVFSNMHDMKLFAKAMLSSMDKLISKDTFDIAIKNYTDGMDQSRGLGFLIVDDRYPQTGKLFPFGSIGHCGHTGQSIFVDLKRGLYVIILSDMTVSTVKKYGQERYENVMRNRAKIHNCIFEEIRGVR